MAGFDERSTVATDTTTTMRTRREEIVREHVESENRHDGPATLATFEHPRYEIVATGEVFDGAEAVQALYDENYGAFPDFTASLERVHHADDSVIGEGTITGTHLGPYRGLPPTGREMRLPICAVFVFDEDRLLSERVYFDLGTLLRQLGVARDPNSLGGKIETIIAHPITMVRALLRSRGRLG
jgi:steroid delta-isomerase-like uncharacterized protein